MIEIGYKFKTLLDGYPLPSLTLCFLLYQFLASWSLMFPFLPTAYVYQFLVTTFVMVWAIHDETNAIACFCIVVTQLLAFFQDIFAMGFHFQDAQNLSDYSKKFEYVLCMMAFFINFFLRVPYALLGFYHFMDRRGDVRDALIRRSGARDPDSRVMGGEQPQQQAPPPQASAPPKQNPFDS